MDFKNGGFVNCNLLYYYTFQVLKLKLKLFIFIFVLMFLALTSADKLKHLYCPFEGTYNSSVPCLAQIHFIFFKPRMARFVSEHLS